MKIVQKAAIWFLLLYIGINRVMASETFFYLTTKSDWTKFTYHNWFKPPSVQTVGFISLLTSEQVSAMANTLFPDEKNLVLLTIEISSADPQLKWEELPNIESSYPRYYGALPIKWIKTVKLPKRKGKEPFILPKTSVGKKIVSSLIPKSLVARFLNYHDWQNTKRLQQLEYENFTKSKVGLQWWYFDFFLEDGSTVVLAFIPLHWWEKGPGSKKNSLLVVSMRTVQGQVKRFSATFEPEALRSTNEALDIDSRLSIRSSGSGKDRRYRITLDFPEIKAHFELTPTQPPFAPYPTGVMPGILQTLVSGAPWGAPSFSYVSQIPKGIVTGRVSWGDTQQEVRGQVYHEQGRLDDTPERQASYWTWYHFVGQDWNIFGSPGTCIYVQKGDRVLQSGFHLIAQNYGIRNRTFSSPDHNKLLTGAEIYFRHRQYNFLLKVNPYTVKTLISLPSRDPSQVWGTVEGPAQLTIIENGEERIIKGRMLLETCSWEESLDQMILPQVKNQAE